MIKWKIENSKIIVNPSNTIQTSNIKVIVVQTSRCPDVPMSKCQDIQMSRYSDVQILRCPDVTIKWC